MIIPFVIFQKIITCWISLSSPLLDRAYRWVTDELKDWMTWFSRQLYHFLPNSSSSSWSSVIFLIKLIPHHKIWRIEWLEKELCQCLLPTNDVLIIFMLAFHLLTRSTVRRTSCTKDFLIFCFIIFSHYLFSSSPYLPQLWWPEGDE